MGILPVNNSTTSPINMLNSITTTDNYNYNNNINNNNNSVSDNISHNFRSQSPFARNAYPGVVLMSPQSASKSTSSSFNQSQNCIYFPSKSNDSHTTNTNHNSNNTKNLLSFDDMLDKVAYESTKLPSIQYPVPLSSASKHASYVPCIDIPYNTTSISNNNNNNTNDNNTSYNTLLPSHVPSPLPQQSINANYPLDQMYPSYLNNQYLDVPSINDNDTISMPISLSTDTNTTGFLQDIRCINHWMKNLSVQQQMIAIDNILSVLSDDILFHTKIKIDFVLKSPNTNMSFAGSASLSTLNNSKISNSLFEDQYNSEFSKLNSLLFNNKQFTTSNNAVHFTQSKTNNHYNNNNNDNSNSNSSGNGTNTNKSTYHPWSPQPVSRKHSSFNVERPKSVDPGMLMTKRNTYQQATSKHSFESSSSSSNANSNKSNVMTSVSNNNNNNNNNNRHSSITTNNHSVAPTNNPMTSENLCDPSLLKNIPAWLKSLRLHKYSSCLSNLPWYTLIYLTDEELEAKGVSALGARRKLLKAFNIVKDCKEQNLIDKSAY